MFTDAVDSYYQHVKTRVNSFTGRSPYGTANNVVAGMLNAQDWPSKDVKFDMFYLLVMGDTPIGRQGYSQYAPIVLHQVQWVWINKGTDLTSGIRMANRGDRYRIMQIMKGELIYGHAPGYAEKQTWSLVNGVWTGTSLNPQETITWNPIDFHEKWSDTPDTTGLGYGAGAVRVSDMTDVITT